MLRLLDCLPDVHLPELVFVVLPKTSHWIECPTFAEADKPNNHRMVNPWAKRGSISMKIAFHSFLNGSSIPLNISKPIRGM